ncbi:IclR family transcriptional regulator [Consotaella aegiceratis]|uniref:IclR family transcriptional regulator n=1 Tax=Consotaella aegiceratis TaxID=3097961 RepID=UPI002F3FE6DB
MTGTVSIEQSAIGCRSRSHQETGAQCIHRSLGVMRLLAGSSPDGVKLVDIAASLELSHPTAHRILKALEEEGVVERVRGSRRYTVGAEVAWLGLAAANRFPINAVAAPALERLSEVVGDSVFLAVQSRNDSIYADRRFGSYPVQTTTLPVGARRPMGISVAGRTMMAFLPERKRDAVLGDNRQRYESYGCTAEMILDGARQARSSGYLYAASVTAPHKRVVSVPVLDMVGAPVAAISVIASHNRLPEERLSRLLPLLRSAAREISQSLTERAKAA